MQHVINLSFNLDDGDIIKRIQDIAVSEALKEVKANAMKKIDLDHRWQQDEFRSEIAKRIADDIVSDDFAADIAKRVSQSIVSRKAFIDAVSNHTVKEVFKNTVNSGDGDD